MGKWEWYFRDVSSNYVCSGNAGILDIFFKRVVSACFCNVLNYFKGVHGGFYAFQSALVDFFFRQSPPQAPLLLERFGVARAAGVPLQGARLRSRPWG